MDIIAHPPTMQQVEPMRFAINVLLMVLQATRALIIIAAKTLQGVIAQPGGLLARMIR